MISPPIRSWRQATSGWELGLALALALVYFGSAKLGLTLAFSNESVTAIWPPTGIALAALVLWGRGLWPGVLLGAFLANVTTDVPVYTAAGIAVGNTLEAVVGAWLLERFGFRPTLLRLRDLFALVVLGAVISTAVSATIGLASLSVGDSLSESALTTWRLWWLGDMGGDLLVASAIFVLVTHWPYRDLPGSAVELVALMVALVGIELVVFTNDVPATYLAFPIVVWAALRFLQPGATLASLIFAIIAVSFTGNEEGRSSGARDDGLLLLRASRRSWPDGPDPGDRHLPAQAGRAPPSTWRTISRRSCCLPKLLRFPSSSGRLDRAGAQGQEAGGDFYDAFETSGGRWVAVIGDVCGKGPEAASLTALARYTLRAVGRQATGPSDALRQLNEAILEQRSDHRFMTAVLVQLDVASPDHGVALSNGGHPHPLVVRAQGEVEELAGTGGMLLGIYSDPELVDQRLELLPGDALVLFTDGLTERRDPHDDPDGRIRELLRSSAGASASETAARLGWLAMTDNGKADDDVAVVVLRRVGTEATELPATPSATGESIAVELEPGPRCPAEARTSLMPLADSLPAKVYLDLSLLVSELVTNSVRHARLRPRDLIRLRIETSDRVVRLEVSDPGGGFSADLPDPATRGPGGWGLFLTERLADRLGVDREGGWTTVWLEVDLDPPAPSRLRAP